MAPLRRLAVLGGTDPAATAAQLEAAERLGNLLAEHGITLLHDGSSTGARGALVTGFQSSGGTASTDFTDYVKGSDAFVALPGGPEGLEQLLANGLPNLDERPFGLLNTGDYFTRLLRELDDVQVERFVQETQRGRLIVERDPAELLRALLEFRPPETRRATG